MGFNNSIRESNVNVFRDTSEKMENIASLKEAIINATSKQDIILESTEVNCNLSRFNFPAKVSVTRSSSFDAAREYGVNNKVCVLNFASATTPGGGVIKGSSAQEECLCRCSTLYKSLIEKSCFEKFYIPHRDISPLHNDDIIYTPDVVIFKEDNYRDLNESDWTKVDVLTCAAPNLKENPNNAFNMENTTTQVIISDDELKALHEKRAKKILEVAASKGCDTLILGAFGCGAFRNKPEVVAEAYKNVLPAFMHAFKNIEFAVYCRPSDDTNYRVFKSILG